jgi:cell division protein FtsX
MRMKTYALIGAGLTWFLFALWLAVQNVILRETALGPVAQVIDKLPPPIASLAFILFWCTFLLGWCIPTILGFRILRRKPN